MFISIEEIHLIYRFPSSPSLMFQFSSHTKKNTNFAGPPPTKRHVPSEDFPQSPHLSMMPCPSPPNKPTCWGCFASSQWRHRPGEIHIGIKKVPGYEENMYPPSYKQFKIMWYNYIYTYIYIYIYIIIDTNGDHEFHKRLGGERGESCRFCKEKGSVGD